jgi:ParB family chromosome partitioning protein
MTGEQGLAAKKIPKRSGLVGAPVGNLSGKDVTAAAARLPSFNFERPPSPDTLQLRTGSMRIRLSQLVDSPYQPRLRYDEGKLSELAESLRFRQIDPLLVRPLPNDLFEVISGHRRKRAAALVQIEELDCTSEVIGDDEARILVLAANEPHEDFADFERALAYHEALTSKAVPTQKQLSDKIGVSTPLLNRRLSMLKLPECVLSVLREYPRTFSSRWVPKVLEMTSGKEYDQDRLHQELIRVATGELQMSALFSVMASARGKDAPSSAATQRGLTLQRGNKLFAQVTPNTDRRQITVKLPGDCSVDEVAELILAALGQRFSLGQS